MSRILEQKFTTEVPEIIASWFDGAKGKVSLEKKINGQTADLVQKTNGYTFVVEWKSAGTVSLIASTISQLKKLIAKIGDQDAIPIVAVPFMGESGRQLCAKEKISWLDLSGNAGVTAPGLRIQIEGKPNQFKSAGRPKNLFAPKSSRVARELLINPQTPLTQRELARKTDLNETLVGRLVRELERENLLIRNEKGAVWPANPGLLLDAWEDSYKFEKHHIISCFSAQRTGEETMRSVAEGLEKNGIEYAATGLAGAWLLSHFASFRIATFYLRNTPAPDLLKKLKITEQSNKGGNIWLVVPNDTGVFDGAAKRYSAICCAHPVQVYLDLKSHPERAREAAEAIREEYLRWGGAA
ncbi:MAG: type IV toxin-antitoxin system AbiEi family antitoxin [Acidobacteriota bacterium]|nr:type IV toxin-antitoxin system AbiEi family antitoxin [Acidobacteriota bacterium]